MGRPRRVHCKDCDRHVDDCGQLSLRGFCLDCGIRRQAESVDQLVAHNGEHFQRWREAVASSVGGRFPSPPAGHVARDGPES